MVALPFGDRDIGLYKLDEDEYHPVPPHDLPFNQVVGWAGDWTPFRDAAVEQVSWHEYPKQDGEGGVVGTLVVRTLVDTVETTVWSPTVPVTVVPDGEGSWDVEVDEGMVGGALQEETIEWEWGTDDSHAQAIAEFLETQSKLLHSVLKGGPGLDPALLVQAIRGPSNRYKRGAVEALLAHREEVVPLLLGLLDDLLGDPQAFADRQGEGFDVLYTVSVLAHLRVVDAHSRLVALGRLSTALFEDLVGGFITEGFSGALLATLSDDVGGLRELIQDRSADEYVRTQAAAALVGAVVLGQTDRAETLAFLATHLVPEAAAPGSHFWGGLAGAMLALRPVEYEEMLMEAHRTELIEPMYFGVEFIEEQLSVDPAHVPDLSSVNLAQGDVHAWLGWWACFDDD